MPSQIETAERIIDALEEQMCRQIDKHCIPLDKIEECVITPDMSDEDIMEREMDPYDAESLLAEHGCTICQLSPSKFRMTDCDTGFVAAGCNIDFLECVRLGGKRAGTFHTHPIGLPIPSDPDIMCSFNWGTNFDFVGGLVGGQKVIVCYMPRDTSEMKYGHMRAVGVMRDSAPIQASSEHEPIGVVRFFREDPGPMASELLDDFDSVFPTDYYDADQLQDFREELEGGGIPDEFWEGYDSEGEWDELEVFDNETQIIDFNERLHVLSSVFFVVVRWC